MGLFLPSICKFILKLCHCNEKTSQNYRPVFLDYYCERALASAWYKKLCHWRISEFPDVKRTNDEKKNLVQDNTKSKRDRKPSDKLSMFLISSRCFFLLYRLTLITPPPPPPSPTNSHFVSLKTFVKLAQDRSLSSKICPEFFREIGRFFREFVAENPTKFDFFSPPIRSPVFWTVYVIKVVDLIAFFSLSPPPPTFFPLRSLIKSNLI